MNSKSFVLASLAGGITDFLLGWLFYGMIFSQYFPQEMPNMLFIALGCLTFGILLAYIFVRWANITTFVGGLKAGATVGFIVGLMSNFFMRANSEIVDYENFAIDMVISLVIGAIVGAVVGMVHGMRLKPR